jgi:hypothetical protein
MVRQQQRLCLQCLRPAPPRRALPIFLHSRTHPPALNFPHPPLLLHQLFLPQASSSSAHAAAGTALTALPALREGPIDALRAGGAASFKEAALALHPVEAVQAQQLANEWETSLRLSAMAHGQAAAMEKRLDRAALSQIRRLPGSGVPSSHALLDTYLGRGGSVGVEDVLNVPELRANFPAAAAGDLVEPR